MFSLGAAFGIALMNVIELVIAMYRLKRIPTGRKNDGLANLIFNIIIMAICLGFLLQGL